MPAEGKRIRSRRKILPALLLCLVFGFFGTHRFYTGKVGTGILQMLTLGGLGLWVLIDAVILISGKFRDAEGAPLKDWA
ncbi:TM2 domain-containing protein [Ketobacter alkanivorans]|uniref:TM2 domain-containing protein n=1 Tax=Ketobacter alkanivorans TaxID=1917421 RepID=A0A2K9LUD3_9GAMM|nr:TM2 domain-containing protein [Ketobacter alkanivorans]AUM14444.1 hypothetical protein Kalk_19315 [Ketobacter alkanivorans]